MTSDLTAALERLKREAGDLCPGDPLDEAIMAVLAAAPPAETGGRELARKAYAVGWSAGIAFTKLDADDPRGPMAFFDEHIPKAEALATPVDPPTGEDWPEWKRCDGTRRIETYTDGSLSVVDGWDPCPGCPDCSGDGEGEVVGTITTSGRGSAVAHIEVEGRRSHAVHSTAFLALDGRHRIVRAPTTDASTPKED